MEKKVLGRRVAHSPNYPLGEPITLQNVRNRLHQKKGFLGYKGDPPSGESDPLPRTTFFE